MVLQLTVELILVKGTSTANGHNVVSVTAGSQQTPQKPFTLLVVVRLCRMEQNTIVEVGGSHTKVVGESGVVQVP